MSLSVRHITGAGALEALAPEWTALWARAGDATPFQHPAWLLAWCRRLPKGTPEALVAEDDGRLAGLLPLCRAGRVLRPLGFDVSDYAEPLVADRPGVLEALLGGLTALPSWDTCTLLTRTPLPPLAGLAAAARPAEPAPALDLTALAGGAPPGMEKSLAEARRRVGALDEATFETPAADDGLDALFTLHARRWRGRGGGVLGHAEVQAFHREAAAGLERAGLLRMLLMRIGGRPAAVFHGFAGARAVHYYIGGFDPEFAPASPGNLVVAEAIAWAWREGFATFDFLKGAERYKYRWGAVDRPRFEIALAAQ